MADLAVGIVAGFGRSLIMAPVSVLFPAVGVLTEAFKGAQTVGVARTLEVAIAQESRRISESASGGYGVSSQFMEVVFGWAAVGGADSYQLEIGTTSGATDYAVLNVGNVLTYTANLPPGTYYARVKAVTGGVPGTASAEQGPFYV